MSTLAPSSSPRRHPSLRLLTLIAPAIGLLGMSAAFANGFSYPATKTVPQIDTLHGVRVPDPYRWLEDPNSPDTKAWIEAENKVTSSYLEKIPVRGELKERLTKLWNFERFGVPFKEGNRYFFTRNDGLQNQAVLYTTTDLKAAPKELLNPNTLSKDGTVALAGTVVSPDGKYLAYGLATGGSDWNEWKVRDVETGADLPDLLKWVKFSSASWTKDGKGFFYSRYDEPKADTKLADINFYHKLYYHRVGTDQKDDVLVYHRPDQKEWGFDGDVTDDGRYLVISIRQGTERKNRLYYKDLQKADSPVVEMLNDFDALYAFIGNVGTTFYFRSDIGAPRGKIIAIDITRPERANWRTIVAEAKEKIEFANLVNQQLVVGYLKDAYSQVKRFDLAGKQVGSVDLPGIGTAGGFGGKIGDAETFYSFASFTSPATIYRLDLKTGKSEEFRRPKVDFDFTAYETKQVFYPGKDGTKVPMFLVHKKGLQLDGNNPVYLYGYGGFNISLSPSFSVARLPWLERGGVVAIANLRGGGEYGKEWHEAGAKLRKQTTFDDFIAAAEWLVQEKYTNPGRIAIAGGSNGGLLVGAAMTQRPDLFAVALPAVGVLDMLRFHKFTIGWAWASDYGSPDKPDDFRVLHGYSPLHNVRLNRAYPATLITTGDHDDRVVPAHSFKFAATLQAAQSGPAPVLIRIETRAGHGAGKPTQKIIEETADIWTFAMKNVGMLN